MIYRWDLVRLVNHTTFSLKMSSVITRWEDVPRVFHCISASLLRHMRRIGRITKDGAGRDRIRRYQIRSDHIWRRKERENAAANRCAARAVLSRVWSKKEILRWPRCTSFHVSITLKKKKKKVCESSSWQQKTWDAWKGFTWHGCDTDITVKGFTGGHGDSQPSSRDTHTHTHTHTHSMLQQAAGAERAERSTNWVLHVNEALRCCSLSPATAVCAVKLQEVKAHAGHIYSERWGRKYSFFDG